MTSALNQARRLYRAYRTTSREYGALAASLGYTRGDLNKRFSAEAGAPSLRPHRPRTAPLVGIAARDTLDARSRK